MNLSEQIEEWKKLCERATAQPWSIYEEHESEYGDDDVEGGECVSRGIYAGNRGLNKGEQYELFGEGDAKFIAAAREAVPALIAEVERLQAKVDKYGRQNKNTRKLL